MLPSRINRIVESFIEDYQTNDTVIGILVVGSYSYDMVDPNSDLDIYIILNKSDYRERGNTWLDGIEVEYFINPLSQIYSYLENESPFRPVSAEMLANPIILKGSEHPEVMKLIKRSKSILAKPLPEMTKTEIELTRYHLEDAEKDILDAHDREDYFAYNLIADQLLNLSINTLLKFKRQRRMKSKLLFNQLNELDSRFTEIIKTVLDTTYSLSEIRNLVSYVENLIGGKRPKEWKLRSSLTI